jgi:hypothetical protein
MVIDQGVDNWQVTIYHDNSNHPPQPINDLVIADGSDGLPVNALLYPLDNDSDPDNDYLTMVGVSPPDFGSATLAGIFVWYKLTVKSYFDHFTYTVSDGDLTATAEVNIYIDCSCTISCLDISAGNRATQAADNIDLPLIYRVRDQVLNKTPDGRRYIDIYYRRNPEILINLMMNDLLRSEAVATVELWQDNLRSLVDADGSAVITQAQVDAISTFLSHLSAASGTDLQQLIADEMARVGPLDDFVGLTMADARRKVIGDPALFIPVLMKNEAAHRS